MIIKPKYDLKFWRQVSFRISLFVGDKKALHNTYICTLYIFNTPNFTQVLDMFLTIHLTILFKIRSPFDFLYCISTFLLHFLLCMWAGRFSRRSFLCHTSSPLSEGSPEKRKSLKLFICWISEGKTLIMWRSWSSPSPLICFTIFTLMARPWVTPQQELAAVLVKSMSFPGGRSKPFKSLLKCFLFIRKTISVNQNHRGFCSKLHCWTPPEMHKVHSC